MTQIVNKVALMTPRITYNGMIARQGESDNLSVYVLTQDDIGQYAVYKALVSKADYMKAESPESRDAILWGIAYSGTKCRYREAIAQFPQIPKDQYRL